MSPLGLRGLTPDADPGPGGGRLIWRRLQLAGHPLALSSIAYWRTFTDEDLHRAAEIKTRYILEATLMEKMVLVSLSFAHMLPAVWASDVQLLIGIALLVLRGFGRSPILTMCSATLFPKTRPGSKIQAAQVLPQAPT